MANKRRISFDYVITIPANQTVEKKMKSSNTITGKITYINIDIPANWKYTGGLRFEFGANKRLPAKLEESEDYFTGDDTNLELHPLLDLVEDRIVIFAVNNDAVNEHNCVVTIEVEVED